MQIKGTLLLSGIISRTKKNRTMSSQQMQNSHVTFGLVWMSYVGTSCLLITSENVYHWCGADGVIKQDEHFISRGGLGRQKIWERVPYIPCLPACHPSKSAIFLEIIFIIISCKSVWEEDGKICNPAMGSDSQHFLHLSLQVVEKVAEEDFTGGRSVALWNSGMMVQLLQISLHW